MTDSVSTQRVKPATSVSSYPPILIAAGWAIFLCWTGRYAMLDDALIHLRYAAVLHDRHFISFDGIHPTYGASSLLYVGLLAVLRSFTLSPLLPKIVSVIAYAGILGLAYWVSRVNRFALALIFVLVSPFAVRWLTDGMETSLACLLAVAFSITLYRNASPLALALIALMMSLLRVDMTLLVAFGVILLLDRKEWMRAGSLCIGSGLSLLFIRLAMGHLLPDTAVAKEGLRFFSVLQVAGREIVATLSFGTGAVLLWMISAAAAWRIDRRSTLICNLPFPTLLLLAAAKGQQMHGIRYLIWTLVFSITWNLLITRSASHRRPVLLIALACGLVITWIFEFSIVSRIDLGRAQNLFAMEHAHLDQLHSEGMAGDVGYIGYFSESPICDMDGLINGRAAAQMNQAQRIQACLAQKPSFLFLSALQIRYLDDQHHLIHQSDWFNCGSVDFTNVAGSDRHWLLVRRADYQGGCPARLSDGDGPANL